MCFRNAGLRLYGTKLFALSKYPHYDQTDPFKGELFLKNVYFTNTVDLLVCFLDIFRMTSYMILYKKKK